MAIIYWLLNQSCTSLYFWQIFLVSFQWFFRVSKSWNSADAPLWTLIWSIHTVDSTERLRLREPFVLDKFPTWFDTISVSSSGKIRTDVSIGSSGTSLLRLFFTWFPFMSFSLTSSETVGPRMGSDLIRRLVFLQSFAWVSGFARDNEDKRGEPGGVQNDDELLGSWLKGSPL